MSPLHLLGNIFIFLFITPCPYAYCTPSNATCWPSNQQIAAFQNSITGELLTPTERGYNASNPKNPFIEIHPYFVLLPANKNDIIQSFAFIRQHNLELSIFSTGHSQSGRSEGQYNYSFQINFSNNKNVQLMRQNNQPYAVKVETGANFGIIYSFVNDIVVDSAPNDAYIVAGGDCPTVALGGYSMGGGEPVLLRHLGLGVDNVLEYEVIIANGSVLIANDTHNVDLFWALRGGGGGTFGVVTNITLKLVNYENGKTADNGFTAVSVEYPFYDAENQLIGDSLLTHFFTECLPMNLSNKINGVISMHIDPKENAVIQLDLAYMGSVQHALNDEGLQCLVSYDEANQLNNGTQYVHYETFQDWHGSTVDDNSWQQYGFDTIVSQENITNDHNRFIAEMVNFTNALLFDAVFSGSQIHGSVDVTFVLFGGRAASNTHNVSLNPIWRTPFGFDAYFAAYWKNDAYDEDVVSFMNTWATTFYGVGGGAYFNDDMERNINWKQQYWASNYDGLLKVKQMVDPAPYLFTCAHCVGDSTSTIINEGTEDRDHSTVWIILVAIVAGILMVIGCSYFVYKQKEKKTQQNPYTFAMLADTQSTAIN